MGDPTHIAWAAGLFEGEGSIEVARYPRSRTCVRLHLNMTDKDVVERFAEVAGCGNVSRVNAPSMAKPNWKPQWKWNIGQADECVRLLTLWLPYFGLRRSEKVAEALAFIKEKENARYRTCYCGKHFRANRGNQWACSSVCRTEWQLERLRMAA